MEKEMFNTYMSNIEDLNQAKYCRGPLWFWMILQGNVYLGNTICQTAIDNKYFYDLKAV